MEFFLIFAFSVMVILFLYWLVHSVIVALMPAPKATQEVSISVDAEDPVKTIGDLMKELENPDSLRPGEIVYFVHDKDYAVEVEAGEFRHLILNPDGEHQALVCFHFRQGAKGEVVYLDDLFSTWKEAKEAGLARLEEQAQREMGEAE